MTEPAPIPPLHATEAEVLEAVQDDTGVWYWPGSPAVVGRLEPVKVSPELARLITILEEEKP
ncbi:MAG TPA: hypothetical protein VFH93_14750 [Thermoleophilia bacterium]|jgi:hypothetical protein|nr:hypothetical protein [Thermoleophilia bacterium]